MLMEGDLVVLGHREELADLLLLYSTDDSRYLSTHSYKPYYV